MNDNTKEEDLDKMREDFRRKRGEILEIAVDAEDSVDMIIQRYIQPQGDFYVFHHFFLNDLTLGPKIEILRKILKYENIKDINVVHNIEQINKIYNITKHSEVTKAGEDLYLEPRKSTMIESEIKTKKIKVEDCLNNIRQYKNKFDIETESLMSRLAKT